MQYCRCNPSTTCWNYAMDIAKANADLADSIEKLSPMYRGYSNQHYEHKLEAVAQIEFKRKHGRMHIINSPE